MYHVTVTRNPLRIQADGTTRAGLMLAALQGLFEAGGVTSASEGAEVRRAFEIETGNAPELLLAVLRNAASLAQAHGEAYTEISFSLVTDKKAVGSFVGRALSSTPHLPAVHGIEGDILKDADGLWRATIALG